MGSLLRRLLFLVQRNHFNRDLEDELRFHEEMKAHALADADGLSGDEARAAARRRIGNPLRLREQSREAWTFPTIETFAQDARHALRLVRRDPAFSFTALATLTLGIGLTRDHRQRDFVRNVNGKLLAYALGRSLARSDEPLIDEMAARLAAGGYRFHTLIDRIVTSRQFLTRRDPLAER